MPGNISLHPRDAANQLCKIVSSPEKWVHSHNVVKLKAVVNVKYLKT